MGIIIDKSAIRVQVESHNIALERVLTLIKTGLVEPELFHLAFIDYHVNQDMKKISPASEKYYPLQFSSKTGRRLLISGVTAGTDEESSKSTLKLLRIMGFEPSPSETQLIGSESKNYFGERNTHIENVLYKDENQNPLYRN